VDCGHVLTHHIFEVLFGQHAGDPEKLAARLIEEDDRRRAIHRVPAAQGLPGLLEGGDRRGAGDVDPHRPQAHSEELPEVGLVDHRLHLLTPVAPLLIEEEYPGVVVRGSHTSPEEKEHHQGGGEQAVHGSGSCKGRATRIRTYSNPSILIRTNPAPSLSPVVRAARSAGQRQVTARRRGEEAGAGHPERTSRTNGASPQAGHI